MTQETQAFKFEIPTAREDLSGQANAVLQLGALAGRLAQEERTRVDHADGRAENVAEHTHMLARIAPMLAAEFYPALDPGRVSLLATIHDDLEAYIGDIPTYKFTPELLDDKELLEKEGLAQLRTDFKHLKSYTELIDAYEAQVEAEARFVRVVDKIMPMVVHFNQGGETLRAYWDRSSLEVQQSAREVWLQEEYPEFADLIALRRELAHAAARELY